MASSRALARALMALLVVAFATPSDAGQQSRRGHAVVVPLPPGPPPEATRGDHPNYAMRPEQSSGARPVSVYLHGICGEPSNGCPYFRAGNRDDAWLACPRAPAQCENGGATWTASPAAQRRVIEESIAEVAARDPSHVDASAPSVLIGFSQGAYVARTLFRRWPHRFRAVVFVGANIRLDPHELRANGVERVVLAVGRYDGSRAVMADTAARLARARFPVRFVDLGLVGHTYVPENGASVWREALAWAREGTTS